MKYHVSHYLYRVAALLIGITACVAAESAPHVPDRDTVVLEQLPLKPTDPSTVELRALRRSLAREPDNTALAAHLAQAYIKRGRIESDPRYLGYAQAALAPWWNLPQPPVNVLVLRAVIHQANHRFDAALADLANALQREPRNVQAWLTRASVEQARGDYAAARRSCLSLARQSATLVGYGCLTAVESLNGEAVRSYALLQQVMLRSAPLDGDMRQWLHGLLAEMAARRGDAPAADAHYRQALAAGTPDAYLLASYADFLLDQGRNAEVAALLRDSTRPDPLLLRLAIAEQRLGRPDAVPHIAALRSRFDASRLRGDVLHRREEAMFNLILLGDARSALQLALDNWGVQREPADVRILLDAALAANTPAAAQPALAWLAETRLEDVYIAQRVQDVKRKAP